MGQETFGEVLLHGLVFRINSAIIEFALALSFEFFESHRSRSCEGFYL